MIFMEIGLPTFISFYYFYPPYQQPWNISASPIVLSVLYPKNKSQTLIDNTGFFLKLFACFVNSVKMAVFGPRNQH